MNSKNLLRGLHPEVNPARLLPAEAAVRIFLPLANANDPQRAAAGELFRAWVLGRDQALSLNHVAYLWANFRKHFCEEAGPRWEAWSRTSRACGLSGPTELAQLEGKIFFMTVFKPWLNSLRRTWLGRQAVRLLLGAGALVVLAIVFVVFWLVGAAGTELLRWLLQLVR